MRLSKIYKLTDYAISFIISIAHSKRGGYRTGSVRSMATDAHRKAVAKFQLTKARVNIWMSPEGKEQLAKYAQSTPEKSKQKYLLRLIRDDSGIDCDPKE